VVETNGSPRSFSWQKDGVDLIDDLGISGSQSNTLTINNVQFLDAGQYQCIIEGYCNNVASDFALIGVLTGIEELNANGIKAYPNPSNGLINIDFENNVQSGNIEILNLNGALILSKQIHNQKETIDLSQFGDGMYFLYIKTRDKLLKTKIIIEK
jgi:hypothetical protein